MNSSLNFFLNSSFPSSSPSEEKADCPSRTFMLCITVLVVLTGLLGNSLVIRFVRRDLKRKKSPDKILLLHISVSNLCACFLSLPLHYLDVVFIGRIPLNLNLANGLCFVKLFSLFFFLQTGYLTLAVLCYDRYEAITKFPQQRLLTYDIAQKASWAIIACIFIVYLVSMIGYIVEYNSGNTNCEGFQVRSMGQQGNAGHVSNIALIVVTSILIPTANVTCFWNLFLVDRKLRHHVESVRSTLGAQSTVKEVRLVYSALSFAITYSVVWIPFGIFRWLRNIYPLSASIRCYYLVTFTCSYITFSLIPVLYIITDKRIRNPLKKYFRKNRIAPATLESSTKESKFAPATLESSTNESKFAPATLESSTKESKFATATLESSTNESKFAPATLESSTNESKFAPATLEISTKESK